MLLDREENICIMFDIDFPTGTLDSVFYTESSVDFYECNFFERCYFSF